MNGLTKGRGSTTWSSGRRGSRSPATQPRQEGMVLVCLRNSKEASKAGAGDARWRALGDGLRGQLAGRGDPGSRWSILKTWFYCR